MWSGREVRPYPRWLGAQTQYPRPLRSGNCGSHIWATSGKPCRQRARRSPCPEVRTSNSRPLPEMVWGTGLGEEASGTAAPCVGHRQDATADGESTFGTFVAIRDIPEQACSWAAPGIVPEPEPALHLAIDLQSQA